MTLIRGPIVPSDIRAMSEEALPHCSFCGKPAEQMNSMIAGPGPVVICDECVLLSLELISDQRLNLRAAYFGFEFIAKLLYPITWLAEQLHIVNRLPN